MYKYQKGLLPITFMILSKVIGFGILIFCLCGTINMWVEIWRANSITEANSSLPVYLTISLLLIILVFPFSYVVGGIFPAIKITDIGLNYRHMIIGGGSINSEEIVDIVDLPRLNCCAIRFHKNKRSLGGVITLNHFLGVILLKQFVTILIIYNGNKDNRDLITQIESLYSK